MIPELSPFVSMPIFPEPEQFFLRSLLRKSASRSGQGYVPFPTTFSWRKSPVTPDTCLMLEDIEREQNRLVPPPVRLRCTLTERKLVLNKEYGSFS